MTRPDGAAVDQALKEDDNDLAIDRFLDEMPSTSNRSVVTRSGRAVKTRINQEFDYSSSQSKGDGEEDSDDESVETEDEDYQLTNDFQEPKWTGRKRRSFETSSSSASSTDSSHSMTSIVYIELGDPVAIIRYDALANVDLNTETELKTKVHKFLGLIPPRRRLYNVLGDCDQEPDDNEHEMATLSVNCLRSPSLHSGVHPVTSSPKRAILPNATPTSTWSTVNLSHLKPPTLEERQAKICNDFVLQANANSIEEQTPDYLKEPPDLSELPSRTQMEINCRRHEISVSCMDHNRGFYRFIESLKRETSINMCHPMARSYREANFNSCKKTLAKMLYNMFNHAIFHCALMVPILWRRRMTTPCQCLLDIRSSGKRTARILLWENINEAGMLVKPLLHEMCHVAAFLFNREAGHGDNCRKWAYQSRRALPELPAIEDCDANFKYTCTMCARCSYGTMDLKKVNLRCHYCQFEVGVKPFSKTDMYEGTRPDLKLTPFKSYVRDKYLKLGEEGGTTHSSKMKLLNEEFAKMN
ncbi:uncharacterized protein LOC108103363 isoform X2 [Drosophila eugracilis]|nr:uncharacterized protein LOC108103363 isoform X2 [Drosophila eugracilis]